MKYSIRFSVIFLFNLMIVHLNAQKTVQPNVIIIITDDQGYGDLGVTGNPHVKTPNIDQFASESSRFNNFYVSPVCAPTRASIMTGRYSLRTGIRDTYNGGAIMATEEITIAEILKDQGYTTGIFGKWHLGDNYPSRPSDQGFDESLIHLSGGMGQVGDFTTYFQKDSSYFDPVLWHNNERQKYEGYCSDIFADRAISFIENSESKPFLCYLSFNAPHTPLQVPDVYYEKYKDIDPASGFDENMLPHEEMNERDKEAARKVYAMVTNIDDHVGRLLDKLKLLKIEENTIVIFMTDNGPQQNRYVAGMKGRKGSVYRGGVRVPFYFRYPALKTLIRDVDESSAHIDILPTIAELCNAPLPADRKIDGRSLVSLLKKQQKPWLDRSLFFYWTRRYPELYNNIAVQKMNFKLVGKTDYDAPLENFELYNIQDDPYEKNNIINDEKDKASSLKREMDEIYQDLISSKNLNKPSRIHIGTELENPTFLNRNDADGERGIWNQEEIYGMWNVSTTEGHYDISFKFIEPIEGGGRMFLEMGPIINQKKNLSNSTDVILMKNIFIPAMDCELVPYYIEGGKRIFPFWVEIKKLP